MGLSGPEDFAIPAAAWEARKNSSPSSIFPSSRFRDHYNSPRESTVNSLSVRFKGKVRVNDELKHEHEPSKLMDGIRGDSEARVKVSDVDSSDTEVRVKVSDEVKHEDDDISELISVRSSRAGEGIKGARPPLLAPPQPPLLVPPPLLAPPPVKTSLVVDNMSSTWDLCRSFGPCDDEDLGSTENAAIVDEVEENEDVIEPIVVKQDITVARLSDSTAYSETCSDISDYDNDDDIYTTIALPSISPNRIFGPSFKAWQKGDFLGSGSFGTVYEGFTDDGFFFAVKEVSLLDQGTQGKQSILQLEQEISLLSRFQHENIVRYHGTDSDDGKLYIFLELVTKGSLASLYQKYHLRDSQVSAYTRQILNGLNYLHKQNVVHRDIKCANILVDVSGSVKLADFGLAKATTLNDVKSCKGTAFWMAPEVVNRKNPGYGLAADIWSLGCTVLEMLTRQIPYSHLEGMQALFRIGRGEPPPIPDSLSSDAQDFILKCLEVNPDKRPTAAQLLDHPFLKRSSLSTFPSPASPHYVGMRT